MSICKHCKQEFDTSDKPKGWMANHSRWCHKNPKRSEYVNRSSNAVEAMKAKKKETGATNQFTKAKAEGYEIESSLKGRENPVWKGREHSEETKKLMSESALASDHRRLRRGMVEYKGVMLDSSWELELAKRLDELGVEWKRPEPIQWTDLDGVTHNYFGDFYLPEYDLYLDPKNPRAIEVQQDKLECLLSQHRNILIIDSLEGCKNFTLDNRNT